MRRIVNLYAFAGKTVNLEFVAFNDEILISNLYIDDISLGDVSLDTAQIDHAYFAPSNLSRPKPAEIISTRNNEYAAANPEARQQLITSLETIVR